MQYLTFFFVFVFGTIIGSFLNVVALRFKTGKTVGGRSSCFSCGKMLGAFELIPLLSFLLQRGKCRKCRSPISKQYPIIEASTGFAFALIALNVSSIFWFFLYAAAFSILIVIAIYDARHKIIPDSLSLLFALLGLIAMLTQNWQHLWSFESLLHIMAGPVLFAPFFLLWLVSGGTWMGLGDAKLAVGFGWLLGLASGLSAIILGIWIGALWSITGMLINKISRRKNSKPLQFKSEIPLAPFLILGSFLAFLFEPDIFSIHSWLQIFF